MSSDLEGDDIWGDAAGSSEPASATTRSEGETKQQDTEDNDPLEDEETRHMTISELRQRIHLLNNDIRVMKSDVQRITHESRGQRERIKQNQEKVKVNKQLPYLVANVVEILEPDAEDGMSFARQFFLAYCSSQQFSLSFKSLQDWKRKKEGMQRMQCLRRVQPWFEQALVKLSFSQSQVWSIQTNCVHRTWSELTKILISF